jgi:hypothetical protein
MILVTGSVRARPQGGTKLSLTDLASIGSFVSGIAVVVSPI